MKTFTWIKSAALLVCIAATVADAQTGNERNLDVKEIIKHSQDAYAALTSYTDEGQTISSIGNADVAPHTFAIKLARPNLYRVEWKQDSGFFVSKGVVWSEGDGDFLRMGGEEVTPTKHPTMEIALSAATGISGGAAGSIPGTFFNLNWGNQLSATMQSATKKPDEKIAGVDCYVLTQTKKGRTQILWIGKQDFLIRQIENDTSAADLKAVLEEEAQKHPEMHLPTFVAGDSKSVETHTNIVVNPVLAAPNFAP